ncbi:MAG: thiamine diphosphokinase [Eubacterium sp.]|nr:thiamine diphosphokinase [Eubacterium sp.]
MGEILIITGGPVQTSFAKVYVSQRNWDVVIAADKGLDFCHACHLVPDLILGDFDSSDQEVLHYYASHYPDRIRRYPARKNETDTELALNEALLFPDKEIHILGALGGRIDHMLANIQLLQTAVGHNRICYLIDENTKLFMTDHPVVLKKNEDAKDLVSLLAYGADVTGLTLEGFAYETKDLTLPVAGSRGISNYLVSEEGKISFTSGILLVIETLEY